ncbi:hypothetical protein KC318_g2257 [Hortaea werneckii]|nr:hypothetical protein KC334_g951 [Hortaea werneckii]KAI7025619.1 hypothetical protein KC355_g951 [Hortaea werneckii]KAI7173639.1 hypothetical protein KC324_g10459 [Hortaea werneckii]KAI7563645.1 hypothetical protein KC316_g12677 [Hortaea werneckii]KAI7673414.1 hypothetical protein KC318_g2257 [Hortaea werneckii]
MAGNSNTKARTTANESGLLEAVQRFWQKSYAGDYFGFILLLAAYIVIQFDAEPFHRLFRLDDPRIQFPHAEVERVPVFWLFIYAAALPLATLMLWTAIFRPSPHKLHVTLLGLAISLIFTSFLTDIFKNAIGRPRPDLLARCDPALDTPVDQLFFVRGTGMDGVVLCESNACDPAACESRDGTAQRFAFGGSGARGGQSVGGLPT